MKLKLGFRSGINVGKLGISGGGAAAPTYSISGTVYDADGSTAVAGATVAIGAASTTSAANGTYTISGLAAGTSGSLTCTKTGYSWTAITVSAMADNLTNQNFTNAWWAAGGSSANATAIYKPIGAASISASKVNIIAPGTHDLTNHTTAPTWDATNGWTFGIGAALISDLMAIGTWTLIVRFSNADLAVESFLIGAFDGTGSHNFGIGLQSNQVRYTSSNDVNKTPQLTSGVLGIANTKGFRAGTAEVTTLTGAGQATKVLWVGALNNNGSIYGARAKYIQAAAIYTSTLTDAQITAVSTAMAALTP